MNTDRRVKTLLTVTIGLLSCNCLTLASPPSNDAFNSAQLLTGATGTLISTTVNSTKEAGEPDTNRHTDGSVWYRWIPPTNGTYAFHSGSEPRMQSQVRVFTGSQVDALTEVYANRRNIPTYTVQTLIGPVDALAWNPFNALTTQEYYIQVTDYLGLPGTFSLSWGSRYAPNDYFRKPTLIGVSAAGTTNSSNIGASPQWAEPAALTGGRSIWFYWKAPFSGIATFDTAGSEIDTLIAVVEPTPQGLWVASISNVLDVASNDDPDAINTAARVTFSADTGTAYWIAVDGKEGAEGNVSLSWSLSPDGRLPDLTVDVVLPGTRISTFPPEHCAVDHGCIVEGERRLLTFPTIVRNQGNADLYLGGYTNLVYEYHPCHRHNHLVGFAEYRLMTNGGGPVTFGSKASFCLEDTSRWDPNSSQSVKQYRCAGIQAGWLDVYPSSIDCQWIDITGLPPGVYVLEQEVDFLNNFPELNESNNISRLVFSLPPLGHSFLNDGFGSEILLKDQTITQGTIVGATREVDEPILGDGYSVWWQWTAPTNGMTTIDTKGTHFDTVLGVFTGETVSTLTPIIQNNDWTNGVRYSRVSWMAVAGTKYHIMVDSTDNSPGGVRINHWQGPVPNDDFEQAGDWYRDRVSNVHASKQPGEPDHAGHPGGHSVWFAFEAHDFKPTTIRTWGSNFDTLLAVYVGSELANLVEVAGNDDSEGTAASVTFIPVEDQQYWIAVDGKNEETGEVVISISSATSYIKDTRMEGATIVFSLVGEDELIYTIETSSDFENWIPWQTFEIEHLEHDTLEITYPNPAGEQLFFRARQHPDD